MGHYIQFRINEFDLYLTDIFESPNWVDELINNSTISKEMMMS